MSHTLNNNMMITLKLIKAKEFELEAARKEGNKNIAAVMATVYVTAYKGNVFNVSSTDFETSDLVVDTTAKTLKIKVDVEIHKAPYIKDALTGEMAVGYKLKEKMDLGVANWK